MHEFIQPCATALTCRSGCGACCIAPSISSPLPGMPSGKPASQPCPHLADDYKCRLFGKSQRPQVCIDLKPQTDMCRDSRKEALAYLEHLEVATGPSGASL